MEKHLSPRIYYGWIIVAASSVIMFIQAGTQYSFGVFFNHLVADFGWSHANTSGIFSCYTVIHGITGIGAGWLVDRFGPTRIVACAGILAGTGLILTSRISELWQIYLTYGLIVGVGFSAGYPAAMAATTRWFKERRGLALGIASTGVGLGIIVISPLSERIINVLNWSSAYFILGIAALAIMLPCALIMKFPTLTNGRPLPAADKDILVAGTSPGKSEESAPVEKGMTIKEAIRHKPIWYIMAAFFFFNFCLQMIMVHLVNYAIDMEIAPFIAATFISVIGFGSTFGRVIMGMISDRIGGNNALLACCVTVSVTVILLIFSRDLWTFYLFSVIFGFAYGGEVPQMPLLIGKYYGMRTVATLVGVSLLGTAAGGASGAWVCGKIFDTTQSYQLAFIVAMASSIFSVAAALALKKTKPVV
ncbi:MFS transporter [Chloroflexota bacterium]